MHYKHRMVVFGDLINNIHHIEIFYLRAGLVKEFKEVKKAGGAQRSDSEALTAVM